MLTPDLIGCPVCGAVTLRPTYRDHLDWHVAWSHLDRASCEAYIEDIDAQMSLIDATREAAE